MARQGTAEHQKQRAQGEAIEARGANDLRVRAVDKLQSVFQRLLRNGTQNK